MQQKPIVYAWIFARGGSKGVPQKNIRQMAGKPLIGYAIETALESELIQGVFVSTDNTNIANIAESFGAEIPFIRPASLASDQAPERLAWQHAAEWVEASTLPAMDVMISLPATSPLRTVEEVNKGIMRFVDGDWDTVISISRSNRHPAFNVVTLSEDGAAHLAMPINTTATRRQDFTPVYDVATAFYVTSPQFVIQTDSIWDGSVGTVQIPVEHAIDIDSEFDFLFAEFLYERERSET